MRVSEIMKRGYYLVTADQPVLAVLALMLERGLSEVVVIEGRRVRGILNRSDIAAQVGAGLYYHVEEQLREKGKLEDFFRYLCPLRAADLRLHQSRALTPQYDLMEAAALFDEVEDELLPVVADENLIGVVCRRDLYNQLLGRPGPRRAPTAAGEEEPLQRGRA
jgi:CBS domain-containing protein